MIHVTICIVIVRRQTLFMFALSQAWRAHCSTQLLLVHHLQHAYQSGFNWYTNEANRSNTTGIFEWQYCIYCLHRRLHAQFTGNVLLPNSWTI